MPLINILQPETIEINDSIRLKKFDGNLENMVAGYQDPVVYQNSEGIFEEEKIPDYNYISRMCKYLQTAGELYFIQVLDNGEYVSIGDVTVKGDHPPIAIWEAKYRGIGIGTMVMQAVISRLRVLGYKKITGTTIYKWNIASQKMHENLGFCRIGETDRDYVYELII